MRAQPTVRGADIDLLETVHVQVALPVNPVQRRAGWGALHDTSAARSLSQLFAPVINVMVYDQRTLGRVLVGATAIPIAPYLPWIM
jgi:hypothetical protein